MGLQKPAPLASKLPVQCLGLMPCSGKLRLHEELCFLPFYEKKINPAVLAAEKILGT